MSSAASFVKEKLRELDAALAATLPRVRGGEDAEAIHDMRVAIRRIRTVLRLSRPLFGRFYADATRRAFADVARATGALRDEEALRETLAEVLPGHRVFAAWRDRRRAREQVLRRAVLHRLDAGELDAARALLHALLVLPVKPSRDAELGRFARRAVERARKEVERRRDVSTDDVEGLHELRIAYKHLRYTAEAFAEVLPADLAALAKPAASFQKRLGAIHDVDVAMASVARARGLPPTTRHRVLRELRALRARRVADYLKEMNPIGATPPSGQE